MSESIGSTEPHDPHGYTLELRDALDNPELRPFTDGPVADERACTAAYELAVALGQCRLFYQLYPV